MKRKQLLQVLLVSIPLGMGGLSCTELDPKVYDRVTTFWNTPDQIAAGVGRTYMGLRGYYQPFGIYSLNECSTDEVIVPTRGGDWYDNGVWEELWKHTWGPSNSNIISAWQFIYLNSDNVNLILQNIDQLDPPPDDFESTQAQLKMIRAFYYYLALDLFGNVPIAESPNTPLSQLSNQSPAEVFDFVENEIKNNLAALPAEVDASTYGRATQWFAQALLAKLYLNAQVYTGTPRWPECIAACDFILNSSMYALEANFFDNFKIANEGSAENIFVIPFDVQANLGYFWVESTTLHYASQFTFGLDFGGYNGFCTTADYLSVFDSQDIRRKTFLVGQQYYGQLQYEDQVFDSSQIQYVSGLRLIFDPDMRTFSSADPKFQMAGARCAKWEFNKSGGDLMSNDFAIFRLADIILMKAEAQFRNGDVAGALTTINKKTINGVSIRSRTGLPDFSAAEMTLEGLLKERARELAWEGWRRNDLIRFGRFTDARIPEKEISENFRTLFPIPKAELDKNGYLRQNPGYN